MTDPGTPASERTIFYEAMEHVFPDEAERAMLLAEMNGVHIVDVLPLPLTDRRGLHLAVCRRGDFVSEPCTARVAKRSGRQHAEAMNGAADDMATAAPEGQPVS